MWKEGAIIFLFPVCQKLADFHNSFTADLAENLHVMARRKQNKLDMC